MGLKKTLLNDITSGLVRQLGHTTRHILLLIKACAGGKVEGECARGRHSYCWVDKNKRFNEESSMNVSGLQRLVGVSGSTPGLGWMFGTNSLTETPYGCF